MERCEEETIPLAGTGQCESKQISRMIIEPTKGAQGDQRLRIGIRTRQFTKRQFLKDRQQFFEMMEWLDEESKAYHRSNNLVVKANEHLKFMTALYAPFTTTERPSSFHSVPAFRSQLQAEFISSHYAKEGLDFFPSKLNLLDTPERHSFSAAANALYLTQMANTTGDQRIFQNAMKSYEGAVHVLRKDLSRPKSCYDDHLFATIHVMSLCEAFTAVSVDDSSRSQHTKGVAGLLEDRGPSSIQTAYMKLQLQQHQEQALWEGLMSRKRPTVGKGVWLGITKQCPVNLTELTTLALHVPGALEDADLLCSRGASAPLEEIMEMLAGFKELEWRLQSWMTQWYTDFKVLPHWKVPLTTLPWLKPFIGEETAAFPSALEFPAPVFAKADAMLWMLLLVLRQATKDVAALHPFPLLASTESAQAVKLHDEIMECADNLCMTAKFFCKPESGIEGYMYACAVVQLASMWYDKIGDADKLAWCGHMVHSIEEKGIKAPAVDKAPQIPRRRTSRTASISPSRENASEAA